MLQKVTVLLREEDRSRLLEMVTRGKESARVIRRAQTLLMADDGWTDEVIAGVVHVGRETVVKTRRRYEERGLEGMYDRPRSGRPSKLDGRAEAYLVAEACSTPPDDRAVWTMQLLADRMVVLGMAESLSDETVRRVLKNKRSSRGSPENGASQR